MNKILGLDIGDVRTGVAISDVLGIIASPLTILNAKEVDVIEEIKEIVEKEKIEKIIYGLPISLDGTEKRQAEKVREFVDRLSKVVKADFIPIDERFSSLSAKNMFAEVGKSTKGRRLDSVSATIILQNYLDMKR